MDAISCLKKLSYVRVLNFATVDENCSPQIRNISAIHYETDALYFFTARGKSFCRELIRDGRVQILGYTMYKEMIRLSAKAYVAREQEKWINQIFGEHPYLANVYPDQTRDIGIVFCIKDAEIEYFNLNVHPIFRESYSIGAASIKPKGYKITDSCVGCGTCKQGCPQQAIQPGTPFRIEPEHCLHCGRCMKLCPASAIRRV